jgi:hypothetical protein
MVRLGLLLVGFSACVITPDHEQVALADQQRTTILVEPPNEAYPGALTLYFETAVLAHPGDDPTDCPSAPDSLRVTVDGAPLTLEESGGWDAPIDGTSECHQIRFLGSFIASEANGVIAIVDDSGAWTITGHSFTTFDHLVVQPSPRGELVVESALGQSLSYAELRVTQGSVEVDGTTDELSTYSSELITVAGDRATMALPMMLSGAVSIAVTGHTTSAVTCAGPAACTVQDPIDGTITATIPAI